MLDTSKYMMNRPLRTRHTCDQTGYVKIQSTGCVDSTSTASDAVERSFFLILTRKAPTNRAAAECRYGICQKHTHAVYIYLCSRLDHQTATYLRDLARFHCSTVVKCSGQARKPYSSDHEASGFQSKAFRCNPMGETALGTVVLIAKIKY